MNCIHCEAEIPDNNNFCGKCGEQAVERCRVKLVRLRTVPIDGHLSFEWEFQCESTIPDDYRTLEESSEKFVVSPYPYEDGVGQLELRNYIAKLNELGWERDGGLADPKRWYSYQLKRIL
jgi:hypothetical protein